VRVWSGRTCPRFDWRDASRQRTKAATRRRTPNLVGPDRPGLELTERRTRVRTVQKEILMSSTSAVRPKSRAPRPAGSWRPFSLGSTPAPTPSTSGFGSGARGARQELRPPRPATARPDGHGERRKGIRCASTRCSRSGGAPSGRRPLGASARRSRCLIIQDLGLWKIAREVFPESSSTHPPNGRANSAGVRQLEAMGFSRVILARECTTGEIAAIRPGRGFLSRCSCTGRCATPSPGPASLEHPEGEERKPRMVRPKVPMGVWEGGGPGREPSLLGFGPLSRGACVGSGRRRGRGA